ncbi:zinc finger SWIM domain-containing protein 8 homolog isoform X2 [Frankliniella occidentalis]|uniref:Zinc finger SWIM domain-containing protein 8 homolog isoform X2 n=1 Tax=Frankliniella occidentalis TaxID=133901 RepID=A0A6J1T0L8_FRAOC|nr:zinc finger SWIM domain-containing protein 8 homolog isoform X2 [Frankliniella occidentalis]
MLEWGEEGDMSFYDSDRFEEDSLCSWSSEPESLCNNWRGWKKPTPPQATVHHYNSNAKKFYDDGVPSLTELCARTVASHIPFELVEHVYPPVPEQLQLRIAYWSFPDNEEDIRLYSCLANGSADEFQRGDQLYQKRAIKDPLQIGFHLSASVYPPSNVNPLDATYNVAVTFDRRRITSCNCTCTSTAYWCSHVVAVCLYRIHLSNQVCLRAPVSESLSRLHRDQLQKFAQYLISELPQQILPTAQRLLDQLLSTQQTAINSVCGAPDPTAGASVSDQTSWYLDEKTLHDNIKKILIKFCVPAPIVFSDVNYLSTTAPPAAAEWSSLLRPLRGREPEGMWNLLSIVREMFKRNDRNAIPLLEIITEEVLACEQILLWWFNTKVALHNGTSGHGGGKHGSVNSNSQASQHACSSLCDEIVILWRLAALNPGLGPDERELLKSQFHDWHINIVNKVTKARGMPSSFSSGVQFNGNQNNGTPPSTISNSKMNGFRSDLEVFPGFRPAYEACYLDWEDYPITGITYQHGVSELYHCPFTCFRHAGDASRSDNVVNQVNSSQAVLNCQLPNTHHPHHFHHHNPHLQHNNTQQRAPRPLPYNEFPSFMGKCSFGMGFANTLVRANGNRSSVSSEGFCENDAEGELLPMPINLPMVLNTGRGSNSSSSSGNNSSSSSNSGDRNHARGGARPKEYPACTEDANWQKEAKELDIENINCFGFDEVENAFLSASRSGNYPKETKRTSNSTDDEDVGLFDVACSSTTDQQREPLKCTSLDAPSDHSKGGQEPRVEAAETDEAAEPSNPNDYSGAGEEEGACGPAVASPEDTDPERRPSKDDSVSSTSDSYHYSGDDYTVYYYDTKAVNEPDKNVSRETDGDKKDDKNRLSPTIDKLLDNVKKETDPWETLFARAEGLHAHGHSKDACTLAVQLAEELLANPPELMIDVPPLISRGKRKKVNPASHNVSCLATATLSKCAFLCQVLAENRDYFHLAFRVGLYGLLMARPPASTKPLEVKLTNQEIELVGLLKKIPLGNAEISIVREHAQTLKDGTLKSRGEALLPTMLASFIFEVLVSPNSNNGCAVRDFKGQVMSNSSLRWTSDEPLGFEAAVAAMGLKANVSEADHPLLCEGTRRQRGDLAIALLYHYKDDPEKVARIMDKLLDRDVHQLLKTPLLPCYYTANPPTRSLNRSRRDDVRQRDAVVAASSNLSGVTTSTAVSSASTPSATVASAATAAVSTQAAEAGAFPEIPIAVGSATGGSRPHSTPSAELDQSLASLSLNSPHAAPGPSGPTVAVSTPNITPNTASTSRSKETTRYKNKRTYPSLPNQPSESGAHFMFELAKTVLVKAGGNSSTSLFTQATTSTGNHHGPHRALHMCAFQIGLYALGLHNCVSPNWLSRTYSSHVSWITGQAMEIGAPAISFLIDTWEGHLTPPEAASIADRASRGCDPNMVSAAAELALSCLPHSHALNPNEITRAILQCKEQSDQMLEQSCLTVETAAKGGGVYPEVLFQVARYWYELFMKYSSGSELPIEFDIPEPVFAMEANSMMVLDPGPAAAGSVPNMGGVGVNGMMQGGMQGGPPQNMAMMPMPFGMAPYGFAVPNNHHPMSNAFNVPPRMPPPPAFQWLPPNQYQYPPNSVANAHQGNHPGTHPTYNQLPQQGMQFYPNMNMRQGGPQPVLTHTVFELRAPGTGSPQSIGGQASSQQQVPQMNIPPSLRQLQIPLRNVQQMPLSAFQTLQSVQGLQQGMPQGMPQNVPQTVSQNMQQGMPQGMPQGMQQGIPQGMHPELQIPVPQQPQSAQPDQDGAQPMALPMAGAAEDEGGEARGPRGAQQLARLFDVVHPRERQLYLLPALADAASLALEGREFPCEALAHIPPNPPQISVVEPSELAKSDIPEVRRLALRGEPMIQVVHSKGPFVVAVPLNPVNSPAQALLPNVPPVNPLALVPQQCQVHRHQQGYTATQLRYLLAAYRVGMLALETLARRVHDDRPQAKYARNPPYGEDVKWLLRVSKKLGNQYLHQFCVCAVSSIVSPFVLHDVALEAAQFLARLNPSMAMQHLRSALTPLVQKCQQMYIQCLHQKLYHLTSADYEDFVNIVCSARAAFQITPEGTQQFKEWLQSIKRSKSCKKDLWAQINAGLQAK